MLSYSTTYDITLPTEVYTLYMRYAGGGGNSYNGTTCKLRSLILTSECGTWCCNSSVLYTILVGEEGERGGGKKGKEEEGQGKERKEMAKLIYSRRQNKVYTTLSLHYASVVRYNYARS